MTKSLHTGEYNKFRALMTRSRERANLTQSQLAARLGKQQSYVSKYEASERRLDLVEFVHVCRALRIDPKRVLEEFLGELDDNS